MIHVEKNRLVCTQWREFVFKIEKVIKNIRPVVITKITEVFRIFRKRQRANSIKL